MKLKPRIEAELFSQLEILCVSPGYLHTIAFLCFRDNIVGYGNQMKVENLLKQYSSERLIRSEISTLIGLACKGKLDMSLPRPRITQKHINETDALLHELHQCILKPVIDAFEGSLNTTEVTSNPFANGIALREAILYGGDSAYDFQYRDLSLRKYKDDNIWFVTNKGYSIQQASTIVSAISRIQNQKINTFLPKMIFMGPDKWTCLPMFTFTIDEIAAESKEDKLTVKSFVTSFATVESLNENEFTSLSDFNPLNAYPIIQVSDTEYLLFQNYTLTEALYETPFFWFLGDESYKDIALKNRGTFTESFSKESLKSVFGENSVFTNVNIYNKRTRVGEIDVLAIFANRAIILQAKSKKLTLKARKGNDNSLKDDFKKAVQEAYDQAFLCATFLNDSQYSLTDADGNKLNIPREYKEIYPFCVVSEHYPSLSFQARQFLKYQTTNTIMPPFIMDVFFLDVICEILQSPLHFLSYVNRRVQYGYKILSNHELTILSHHLKKNLWVEGDNTMLVIQDDLGADIDLAMLARRNNVPGGKTPEGILTKYQNTFFGRLINQIDKFDSSETIDLGFLLLKLDEDTVIHDLNHGISKLLELHKIDGKDHDLTLVIEDGNTGLTIHCNNNNIAVAKRNLEKHCLIRKYTEKAKSWFGICINPADSQIKFGINFDFEWIQSKEMDEYLFNS
jgi:hypothetical protein